MIKLWTLIRLPGMNISLPPYPGYHPEKELPRWGHSTGAKVQWLIQHLSSDQLPLEGQF